MTGSGNTPTAARVVDVLRQHRSRPKRVTHPRNDRLLLNITACTGCEWTTERINAAGEDDHAEHVAAAVLEAPTGAIYDPRRDNLTCLLPVDRPDEVWTRTCRVWCSMCDATEEFFVVTAAPTQELANKSLAGVMAEAGWTYGGEDADEDFCPDCSRVGVA